MKVYIVMWNDYSEGIHCSTSTIIEVFLEKADAEKSIEGERTDDQDEDYESYYSIDEYEAK